MHAINLQLSWKLLEQSSTSQHNVTLLIFLHMRTSDKFTKRNRFVLNFNKFLRKMIQLDCLVWLWNILTEEVNIYVLSFSSIVPVDMMIHGESVFHMYTRTHHLRDGSKSRRSEIALKTVELYNDEGIFFLSEPHKHF